jgi:hypothetical protein
MHGGWKSIGGVDRQISHRINCHTCLTVLASVARLTGARVVVDAVIAAAVYARG